MSPFEIIHRDTVYRGRVFSIIRDEVIHRSGYRSVREVVQHAGGAVVVPVFPNRDVLLIRQFRYPIQREIIELPAGKLAPGEDPAACAARELEEETGWCANSVEKLTAMMTTPGFCSEVLHIYLATDLTPGRQQLEQGEESITLLRMPIVDALTGCLAGDITDGKTIAGITLAAMRIGTLSIALAQS